MDLRAPAILSCLSGRLAGAICVAALWVSSATAGDRTGAPRELDDIIARLAEITGLKPLKKVRYDSMDKEQLKRYLDKRMSELVKPEEVRVEELTLKKFGFVPQDYDLRSSTIELLTEQAAAFYDFRKDRLFLVSSGSSFGEEGLLAHELSHALADQHFNLDRFVRDSEEDDDSAMARMAVMEGQASWLMSEYAARRAGRSLAEQPELVEMLGGPKRTSEAEYPVLANAPLYIRETLMFPYTRGMLFQHRVYERMGQPGFAEVFRRPPVSTQQIIHPELYFSGAKPAHVATEMLPGYRKLAGGSVGELDHVILLGQYAGEQEAQKTAPRWRGGAYALLESKKTRRLVLSYVSQWDSEDTAKAFLALYRRVLAGKWRRLEVDEESTHSIRAAATMAALSCASMAPRS